MKQHNKPILPITIYYSQHNISTIKSNYIFLQQLLKIKIIKTTPKKYLKIPTTFL